MEKWEYKIFKHVMSYTEDFEGTLVEHKTTKAELNKLGQKGWELVSTNIYDYPVHQKHNENRETDIFYFLKRKTS